MLSNGSCRAPERARRTRQRPPSKMDSDTGIDCGRRQMRINKGLPTARRNTSPSTPRVRNYANSHRRVAADNLYRTNSVVRRFSKRRAHDISLFLFSNLRRAIHFVSWVSQLVCRHDVRFADTCAREWCIVRRTVIAVSLHTRVMVDARRNHAPSFDCHVGAKRRRLNTVRRQLAQCNRSVAPA